MSRVIFLLIASLLSVAVLAADKESQSKRANLAYVSEKSAQLQQFIWLLELDDAQLRCQLARFASALEGELNKDWVQSTVKDPSNEGELHTSWHREDVLKLYSESNVSSTLSNCLKK